jgi:membrane protein YqaA with SNARE-associated domain
VIDRLIAFLQTLGLPGLLGLAFVDSAGLPTGGGPDWMLLALAASQPMMADLLAFVPAAVSGSALGCLVPYYLGRKGGQPFLARFGERRHAEVRDKINRYGLWTIVFSVVAPPPYPMKLFMLSAGVFGMPLRKFIPAVLLGRTARYLAVGYLAVRYGEQATILLRAHYPLVLAVLVFILAACLVVDRWWSRRKTADQGT